MAELDPLGISEADLDPSDVPELRVTNYRLGEMLLK